MNIKPQIDTIDTHTRVVTLHDNGNDLELLQYGEIGDLPYFTEAALAYALKVAKPRTNDDRVEYLSNGRYDVQVHRRNGNRVDWIVWDNEEREYMFGDTEFGSWIEAVDALMDQDEQV